MDKKEIRKEVFARRKKASDREIEEKSAEIFDRICAADIYQKAQTVFTYMDYRHEVMTRPFIERCWKDGKRVAVPKVNGKIMNFYYLDSFEQLASGCMGIMEPAGGEIADSCEDSLIIVPGVAFDPQRHRVGYGGGFYDRYLSEHTHHATIAVAFQFQIFGEVPHEEFDLRPDFVCTEENIYR